MGNRNRGIRKLVTAALLGSTLVFSMVFAASAETKEEVQAQIESLKDQQAKLKSQLKQLKKNKTDTETYIAKLDKKIDKFRKSLEKITAAIIKTDAEITITEENLAQAREDEKAQYEALKLRIKAMYEAGEEDYIQMLLNSDDLKELLNGREYSSKINEYDHELLVSLQETTEKIAEYEKELEEKKELQEAQKEKYEIQKENLETVLKQKKKELKAIGEDIDSVSYSETLTQEEIDAENAVLAEIIYQEKLAAEEAARKKAAEEAARKKAAEEAAAAAAAAAESNSGNSYYSSGYDYSSGSSSDSSGSSSDSSGSSSDSSGSSSDSSGSSSGSGSLSWPVDSYDITSYYGYRDAPTAGATTYHRGIDIAASSGSSISSASDGVVTQVSYNSAMGNYVVVDHGNGVSTIYEHCSSTNVSVGQSVSQGETIAAVGSTGVSTGAHLHFGVTVNGEYVDPLLYVN